MATSLSWPVALRKFATVLTLTKISTIATSPSWPVALRKLAAVLTLTKICTMDMFQRWPVALRKFATALTPSLPQPVKFPGWKLHAYTPPNSIFDGPITNLLSILSILTEIFSRAHGKGAKKPYWFQIWPLLLVVFQWRRGKHGSERVNSCPTQQDGHVSEVTNCFEEDLQQL